MRSFSDQIVIALPATLAVVVLVMFAMPVHVIALPLVPNVAWVMGLIVPVFYPPAWPRGFAFCLGLLQDVLFGTPLGSQALLSLLLVQLVRMQARRQQYQPFRVRWLEAAGALVVWHALLWAILHFVSNDAPNLRPLATAGLVSAAWFPVFYYLLMKLILLMPSMGARH